MSFYPSDSDDEKALVDHIKYLFASSEISRGDLFLKRIDYDRQLKKEIAKYIEKAIENMALVRLAELLRRHGPEIREALRGEISGSGRSPR
jgi:hypothetical protein